MYIRTSVAAFCFSCASGVLQIYFGVERQGSERGCQEVLSRTETDTATLEAIMIREKVNFVVYTQSIESVPISRFTVVHM
jgi:hypothetical protein